MKIFYDIKKISRHTKNSVIAIGIFDGVHLGHQKILKKVTKAAKAKRLKSVVLTFEPHPASVLSPRTTIPFLTTLTHRLNIIAEFGIDVCVTLKFNKRLAALSAEGFTKNILVDKLDAKRIVVGKGFLFGRSKKANANSLKNLGKKLGFMVECTEQVRYKKRVISSTRIRASIEAGKLCDAVSMLGRRVSVFGTVVKGDRRGNILGFPTANINPHHEAIPPSGVYAVRVSIGKKDFKGILNIGRRPTFYGVNHKDKEPLLEVHIFGFDKMIYGKDIEVQFIKRIRAERKFSNRKKLIEQIQKDIIKTKELLS